jgi:hypothetical protein
MSFRLTTPPKDERNRELWLQHAAGFILFQDMRKYAIDKLPSTLDDKTREIAINAIDDTVYGLMMIMDGVTGSVSNNEYTVTIESIIRLDRSGERIQELNTLEGDGMCMGFHGWVDGDFGMDEINPVNEVNE